ncbi:MAG: hypothetical protein HQ477_04915, partial [Chloroflexi bacterium]|nr:hypothetical protein [Chloroflexota bacterium]
MRPGRFLKRLINPESAGVETDVPVEDSSHLYIVEAGVEEPEIHVQSDDVTVIVDKSTHTDDSEHMFATDAELLDAGIDLNELFGTDAGFEVESDEELKLNSDVTQDAEVEVSPVANPEKLSVPIADSELDDNLPEPEPEPEPEP